MNIVWFRYDLRLEDNHALYYASKSNDEVLPLFIIDDNVLALGQCSLLWLYYSLLDLNKMCNNKLMVIKGKPNQVIDTLITKYDIKSIFYNKVYEPQYITQDNQLELYFQNKYNNRIRFYNYNSSLLFEPNEIKNKIGNGYSVFTPFYKCCLDSVDKIKPPLPQESINYVSNLDIVQDLSIFASLVNSSWGANIVKNWSIGSSHAILKLDNFLAHHISDYKVGRDIPSLNSVSRLSPHIHFGEISVDRIWHRIKNQINTNSNYEHFFREICWREFSYNILFYNHKLPLENINHKFDKFRWSNNLELYHKWTKGITGIPIVDAGMRELWQTGYMHNRIRMIVGSFLVKNLLIDWRLGAKWFYDCLFDANLASNSASWQWVSGCGVDAAPYFRIFNPILQGQKFDANGIYIKKYVPELSNISDQYLFSPWLAPTQELQKANIKLGVSYPYPIIDLAKSRILALEIYKSL